ncbi:MAG: formate/nitrite transporter family protein [Methylovirgula sp.]
MTASKPKASSKAQAHSDATHGDMEPAVEVTQREIEDIEDRSSPRPPVIYEIVRRQGEEEMARPVAALWWSGLAAGLSISASLVTQAVLEIHLPDAPWRPLVTSLGYCFGFLLVVLPRQQLFTESTITAVLPLLACFKLENMRKLARLWTTVLIANVIGTMIAAAVFTYTPMISPELHAGMLEISRGLLGHSFGDMLVKAVPSGFLIAAMVWLMPSSNTEFHVVALVTYLIAAAGFMHIVAGSVEAFFLALNGGASWGFVIGGFLVPVLIGNIIGGTALFGLIAYGQVAHEFKG